MKKISLIPLFLFSFLFLYSQEQDPVVVSDPKGAIIIAQIEGEVSVINNLTGEALPTDRVKSGGLLFDGHTVKTGSNAKVVLLLSNGTVSTLKAESVLNIKKFTQSKFDPGTAKLSELEGEPSSSDVLIDLNIGDMVVDIKKLDKKSSFNIDSPVGTAGIRGTRVGMNIQQAPGGGFTSKVTVPQGVISFTPPPPPPSPPGVAPPPPPEPVPVSAGQAVTPSVSSTGTVSAPPVPAPAPPSDLAAIDADLDTAVATTADVSVAEVSSAVNEVAAEAPPEAPAETAPAEESAEEPSDEPAPTDEPSDEPSDEPAPTDEPAPADEPSDEPAPADAPSDEPAPTEEPAPSDAPPSEDAPPPPSDAPPSEDAAPPSSDAPPADAPPPPADAPAPPADAPPSPADAPPPPLADTPPPQVEAPPPPPPPQIDNTSIVESDPLMRNKQKGRDTGGDVVKAMKTEALISAGVIDESSATDSEKLDATLTFVDTVTEARDLGVDMSSQLTDLGTKSVEELEAKTSFTTSQNQLVEEGVLTADDAKSRAENSSSLSVEQLNEQSQSNNNLKQQLDQGLSVEDATLIAENETAASESPELLQLLDELKGLNLTDMELSVVLEDLKVGPQVDAPNDAPSGVSNLTLEDEFLTLSLLEDHTISDSFDGVSTMLSSQAFASAFFSDLVDTYDALSGLESTNDSTSDTTDNVEYALGGRNISISSGTYNFISPDSSTYDFLIAATDKLSLLGDIVFNPGSSDSTLIMISAQSIDLADSTSISFTGYELGIGSFNSLNVKNISLTAEGGLSLRSLDNVVINNSSMTTSGKGADFVHLLAANEITANSLQFSSQVKQITMEAMTINLSNINFPSGSSVNLNSLYGAIDGKYPNFGSTQYGRVNFIQNMMYGSNALTDTSSFDLHGGSITIGTSGL